GGFHAGERGRVGAVAVGEPGEVESRLPADRLEVRRPRVPFDEIPATVARVELELGREHAAHAARLHQPARHLAYLRRIHHLAHRHDAGAGLRLAQLASAEDEALPAAARAVAQAGVNLGVVALDILLHQDVRG